MRRIAGKSTKFSNAYDRILTLPKGNFFYILKHWTLSNLQPLEAMENFRKNNIMPEVYYGSS